MNPPKSLAGGRPILGHLTSLRFFAATAIVLHHFGSIALGSNPFLDRFLLGLRSGVSFFFVLSGFVLVYAYDSPQGLRSVRGFFAARFARVYPVYLLGLVLTVPLAIAWLRYPGHPSAFSTLYLPVGLSLLLVQAWVPPCANLLNGPAWSLSVEAFFYAAFPFLLLPKVRKFLGSHRVAILLPLLLAGSVPLWILHLSYPEADLAAVGTREFAMRNWTYFWPLFRLPEFVLGVVVGFEFQKPHRNRIPSWSVPAALAGIVSLLLLVPDQFQVLFHNSLLAPLFAVIIYGLATSDGTSSRLLSNKWLVLLGESSYALYLLHLPVELIMAFLWRRAIHRPPGPAFFGTYLALTILGSVVVFTCYESPLRKRLRSALSNTRKTTAAKVG